jgi:maleamate amidohydrolase
VRRADSWDEGAWAFKNSRVKTDYMGLAPGKLKSNIIVPDIAPAPQDLVIGKQKPSAFHGTPLADYLVQLGCDSVICTGTTTSGCVRATVVDAFSRNYRVIVAEEGCADRSHASHAVNLCDMNAKYGDVVSVKEVVAYLGTLRDGLFDLPNGDPTAAAAFSLAAKERV